ncbi:MAG: hypothetical protein HC795_04425 [Coleofasciculaceae cyanobacterium RL_1_1]|nr:hypothetical protein [Coleofasciculaceae cyanobacterium RL_1_1]
MTQKNESPEFDKLDTEEKAESGAISHTAQGFDHSPTVEGLILLQDKGSVSLILILNLIDLTA